MLFKNETGKDHKTRDAAGTGWLTILKGEEADLPEEKGHALGFTPIEEVEADAKPDPKEKGKGADAKKDKEYASKLKSIKGIGKKTVEDILKVFKTEGELKKAIKSKEELPFRDDVDENLRKNFK